MLTSISAQVKRRELRQFGLVAGEMDELPLPYRFDVEALDAIRCKPLREHIRRAGASIYEA
jgi:hypothetical protein